jgi:hypothetical protein
MTDKRKSYPKYTSPRGTFRYPKLTEPDFGNEKFPKPDGEYKVDLILSSEEAKPLIEKLQPLHDEAMRDAQVEFDKLPVKTRKEFEKKGVTGPVANSFYSEIYDEETEEPTGDVYFRFKMKASGKSKKTGKVWKRKPVVFDAKGKPMVNPPEIWGGTIGKVSFEAVPYFISGTAAAGVRLSLSAAQVIELRSGGGGNAESYGFGEEEGYEYSDEDAPAKSEGFGNETSSDDGEEDF